MQGLSRFIRGDRSGHSLSLTKSGNGRGTASFHAREVMLPENSRYAGPYDMLTSRGTASSNARQASITFLGKRHFPSVGTCSAPYHYLGQGVRYRESTQSIHPYSSTIVLNSISVRYRAEPRSWTHRDAIDQTLFVVLTFHIFITA